MRGCIGQRAAGVGGIPAGKRAKDNFKFLLSDAGLSGMEGIEDIAICRLTSADVVRHVLVQRIIEAYEKHADKPAPRPTGTVHKTYRRK